MKFNSLLIILGTVLLFGACSDDDSAGITPPGENVAVQLSFKTVAMQQAGSSTRSGGGVLNLGGGNATGITFPSSGTRSTDKAIVDESTIKNLWVFQYVAGGNFVRKQYFSTVDVEDFRMDLSKNASGEKSNLYFVANVGPNAFPDVLATEAAFKANGISVTNEASVLPTAGFLPMYGSLTDLTLPDDFVNNSNTVTMTRMVNRVDLNFQLASTGLPTGFLIKSVRLMNIPNKSFPYKDASANTFPATTDVTFRTFDYEDIAVTDQVSSAVSMSFYLPENVRGEGIGSTAADKSGITGATCIQLMGYTAGDEITYSLYPGGDVIKNYDLVRNTTYTVNAGITGINENDARVRKTPLANTYIVRPGASINIPVKQTNMAASDIGTQLTDLATGWSSAVLWRDNSTLTVTTDDSALQSEGFFRVKVSDLSAEGNAVVYITDGSNILWSWQIWVTNYDPASENETYNGYTFMDRNLGAFNKTKNNVGALGLFYQWGRKDPFAGANAVTSGTASFKNLYSGGSGTTTYTSSKVAAPTTSANNLENAVRHPQTFYYSSSDWYPGSNSTRNNLLWGVAKTVYDPCPAGWKVPPMGAFSTWSSNTIILYTYGVSYNTEADSWYPFAGGLRETTGALTGVGNSCYLWSSTISSTGTASLNVNVGTSNFNVTDNAAARSYGLSVRCIQEN